MLQHLSLNYNNYFTWRRWQNSSPPSELTFFKWVNMVGFFSAYLFQQLQNPKSYLVLDLLVLGLPSNRNKNLTGKDGEEPYGKNTTIREILVTELLVMLFTVCLDDSLILIFTGLNKTLDEVICGKLDAAVKEGRGGGGQPSKTDERI